MRKLAVLTVLAIATTSTLSAHATTKDECFDAAEAGQALKKKKKLTAARPKLVTCASDACPAIVRDDCVRWLADVDASLPTVVFRVRDDAGKDVVDVRVLEGGVEILPRLTGAAVPMDPGEHVFRFEPKGRPAAEETVLVTESEKARVVLLELHDPKPKAPPPPVPVVAVTPPPPPPKASPWPWVVGGVGVASLATFGVLQALLQSEYSDLEGGCGRTRSCTEDDVSGVETKVALAKVTFGVGLAALAVAVPWLILDHPRTKRSALGPGGFRF